MSENYFILGHDHDSKIILKNKEFRQMVVDLNSLMEIFM